MPTAPDELKRLWQLLPRPTGDHVVRLYSRTLDGQGKVGDYARSLGELRRFVKSQAGKNVYVSPNPTCSKVGVRHSTADVTHWSWFLLDLDPIKDAVEPDAMNALEFALIYLGSWWGDIDFREGNPYRPLILDSGRGAQAWFRLEDIDLDAGGITRKEARKAMGYWLNRLAQTMGEFSECTVDTSTSDLPRLMRCPGTSNAKTGREAKIIHEGAPYPGLAQLIVSLTPKTVFEEPDLSNIIPGRTWQMAYQDLTKTAQQYLTRGMLAGGRHKAVFSTARKLCEVGVSMKQARKGIRRANELHGPNNALDDDEIENALKVAYEAS